MDQPIRAESNELHRDNQDMSPPTKTLAAGPTANQDVAEPKPRASSAKTRKRTKTGCLTCRRRRIKCGEERPICSNCVKSKRNCEGYTPRVIFKDPIGACRPVGGTGRDAGSLFQPITNYPGSDTQHRSLQPRGTGQLPLPAIAPQPSQRMENAWPGSMPPHIMPAYYKEGQHLPFENSFYPQNDLPPQVCQQVAQRQCSLDTSPVTPETDTFGKSYAPLPSQYRPAHQPDRDSGIDVSYPGLPSHWSHSLTSSTLPTYQTPVTREPLPKTETQSPPSAQLRSEMPFASGSARAERWTTMDTATVSDHRWNSEVPSAAHTQYDSAKSIPPRESMTTLTAPAQSAFFERGFSQGDFDSAQSNNQRNGASYLSKSNKQYDPTIPTHYDLWREDPDDDYFDVTSDDEPADADHIMSDMPASKLSLMLAPAADYTGGGFRSLTNFLNEPNVLSSYRPSYAASPLMDPQTARVFCHFITATAPTLSIHNRYAVNPSAMFTGEPVPAFQRSLFTYTLPMLALSNQGLLHAQLALASLHIAKLQQTSPTPSLRHYHYALRRVAKAVGHPTKRREVATLAATLLLGFFEVTTAEHNKWNSHLAGARELILEIDFAGMTKRINAYKAETVMIRKGGMYDYRHERHGDYQRRMSFDILRTDKELDMGLINIMTGWKIQYDVYGRVIDTNESPSDKHIPLAPKDVENFEIQCDLFWWYAKQDMYQSLISGNRLLLPYDRWSHCPPRAPVGRLDALHGSMDHLILLFARLTEFAARDRARKIKVHEKAANSQSPPRPPPMYGMMPAPGHIHLPPAFDQSRQDCLTEANKITVKDTELDLATRDAEREWAEICAAIDVIEEAFGPDFQPLSPDHMTPLSTPFGPAIYYRTYSIACTWSLFFTARVCAARVAPAMPPAAMVAAGVAAPQTAHWANIIGRICGGMQPFSSDAPLNPSHGAALMDSCMGLFHAGIQFRDAAQRGWTITKLRNVARLTGWQTSAIIASGCERAWMAAADMGRGPPYTRTMNATAKDDRVSGRSRVPNQGPPKDNNDRRFIPVNPGTRVYWAMGILSAEEDMKQLKLE